MHARTVEAAEMQSSKFLAGERRETYKRTVRQVRSASARCAGPFCVSKAQWERVRCSCSRGVLCAAGCANVGESVVDGLLSGACRLRFLFWRSVQGGDGQGRPWLLLFKVARAERDRLGGWKCAQSERRFDKVQGCEVSLEKTQACRSDQYLRFAEVCLRCLCGFGLLFAVVRCKAAGREA
jgi:hypothetical protein